MKPWHFAFINFNIFLIGGEQFFKLMMLWGIVAFFLMTTDLYESVLNLMVSRKQLKELREHVETMRMIHEAQMAGDKPDQKH